MKQLLLTCFLSVTIFLHATAGIVYTSLSPVKTLSQASGTYTPFNAYMKLDLNNDGTTDYSFRIDYYASNDYYAHILCQYPVSNYIATMTGSYVVEQTSGAIIGSGNSWGSASSEPFLGDTYKLNLINKGDALIAMKFKIGSNFHFGWMRLNVALGGGTLSITVKNYAYEDVPNTSIAAGNTGTLPLQLTAFNALRNRENVSLKWQVQQAVDVQSFIIEKSLDAARFYPIATIPFSQNGGYTHSITAEPSATVYYRLKIIDKDGAYVYSAVVKVLAVTTVQLDVWPNPCNDQLMLGLAGEDRQQYQLRICTMNGETMYSSVGVLQSGWNTIPLSMAALPTGTYVLQMVKGGEMINKTFLKR